MRWEGKLFIDTVLPDANEWVVRQEGLNSVFHYRDNFLIISNPAFPDCDVQLLDTTVFDSMIVSIGQWVEPGNSI